MDCLQGFHCSRCGWPQREGVGDFVGVVEPVGFVSSLLWSRISLLSLWGSPCLGPWEALPVFVDAGALRFSPALSPTQALLHQLLVIVDAALCCSPSESSNSQRILEELWSIWPLTALRPRSLIIVGIEDCKRRHRSSWGLQETVSKWGTARDGLVSSLEGRRAFGTCPN